MQLNAFEHLLVYAWEAKPPVNLPLLRINQSCLCMSNLVKKIAAPLRRLSFVGLKN